MAANPIHNRRPAALLGQWPPPANGHLLSSHCPPPFFFFFFYLLSCVFGDGAGRGSELERLQQLLLHRTVHSQPASRRASSPPSTSLRNVKSAMLGTLRLMLVLVMGGMEMGGGVALPPSGDGGVEAQMRPRAELEAGSLAERLAAQAAHDAARLAALNTQIQNAVVARRSGFASGASFTVSAGPGVYEMELRLGTPAKPYSLIMDTGSQLVWVQCAPCDHKNNGCLSSAAPPFQPDDSSTYSAVPCSSTDCQTLPGQCELSTSRCRYTYSYASQASTQGLLATDTVSFGTSDTASIVFGCGFSNKGDYGGAAGLVGMGQSPLSLPSQLGPSIGGKRFSYCLSPSSSGGTPLLLGSSAPPSLPGMLFTPMLSNPSISSSLYYLSVADFSLASRRLNIPAGTFSIDSQGGGGMILDSGTTYTYLPSAAFHQLRSAFESSTTFPKYTSHPFLPACYLLHGTDAPASAVPPLTIHLQGADLPLPPDNYFIPVDGNGTFCLAFIPTSGGLQIIGNILHRNFQVLYDLDASRIGFLPVNSCATSAS